MIHRVLPKLGICLLQVNNALVYRACLAQPSSKILWRHTEYIRLNHLVSVLVFFLTQWLCFYGPAPSVAGALVVAGEERRLWTTAGARGLSLLSAHLCGSFCSQLRCICVLAAVACVVWVSCVWVSCKCWVLIPSFFLIQWDVDLLRFSRKKVRNFLPNK